MSAPRYLMHKNELVVVCDTPESEALAENIRLHDRGGKMNSDFWGHPTFGDVGGVVIVKLPLNIRNIAVLHECGCYPSVNDEETTRRFSFFKPLLGPVFSTSLPLMDFQKNGGEWLRRRDMKGILAFDMGLGKTLTSISALLSNPERYLPAIIMAPAHVKLNWESEWTKWGGDAKDVAVLFGRSPDKNAIVGRKLVVLNHHILAGWAETLMAFKPKMLLIDEAHNFVNSNTKTYPLVEKLAAVTSNRVLLLTATPLVNDLGDLWGLCNLISHDILGNKTVFSDTFMPEDRARARLLASRWRGGFSKTSWRDVARARLPKAVMDRRLEELKNILHKTVMLRKKRSDVLTQLPDITETDLRIELPRTTPEGIAFWDVEDACATEIANGKADILASDKMLAAYTAAKRNAAMAKIPYAEEWIRTFLSETEETEKLVVAGWAVDPLSKLHEIFKRESVLINGDIDATKKHRYGKEFATNPKKRIVFGNYKSIGTGIDQLVVARTMMLFELPQTAVDFDQVKGRIDRLSQKAKALMYYYMTIRGSIEEKHGWALINRKRKISGKVGL